MTYTNDANALDAATIFDAVARKVGKRGFVITMHDDGKGASISTIGDMSAEVDAGNAPDPAMAYENCGENSESYRSGKSAKKDQPANDAARISRLSAEAKKATADAMLRNRSYAAILKAKSAALQPRADLHKVRPI